MLYRHVPNKAAVLDGVAEIVLAQLLVDNTDPNWAAQLRTVAHHFRQVSPGPPPRGTAAGTRPLATPLGQRPPEMLRPLENVLALLTSAGFSGDERTGSLRVHLDAQVDPIQQRARQFAEVSALGHGCADAVAGICRRTRAQVGSQYQLENAPDSAPPRLGEQAESSRLPMEFAAPPVRSRRSRRTRRGTALPGELG